MASITLTKDYGCIIAMSSSQTDTGNELDMPLFSQV